MLIIILSSSVMACNKTDNLGNDLSDSQDEVTTPNNATDIDTTTVSGYLSQFGLTEEDIKPDGFTSFEGPDGWLIKINAGEYNFDNWSKKVFDTVKSISTDSKIFNEGYPSLDQDEAIWSAGNISFQWAYNYNGKVVNITVTFGDTSSVYRLSIH